MIVGSVIVVGVVASVAIVLALNWPFTQAAVTKTLEDRFARQVTIHKFHSTYFPPGFVAEGIDFLHREWNNKAAGFVSYGSAGGARAGEHLRLVMAELMVATVRAQVMLSLFTDFEKSIVFKPAAMQEKILNTMLDHVIAWSGALRTLRDKRGAE